MSSTRALEDLVIDAMYLNLLGGRFNQQSQTLSVDWVVGRDVHLETEPGSEPLADGIITLGSVKAQLETWCTTAKSLLDDVEGQINVAQRDSRLARDRHQVYIQHRNALYTTRLNEASGSHQQQHHRENAKENARGTGEEPHHSMVASSNPTKGATLTATDQAPSSTSPPAPSPGDMLPKGRK